MGSQIGSVLSFQHRIIKQHHTMAFRNASRLVP
jgi:hypothetical protein